MEVLEICSRVKGRGAVCALPPPLPGGDGRGLGTVAVLP